MNAKDCDFVDKLQEQREGQSGSGLVEHASVVADPDWHSEVLCDNLQEADVFTSRSDPQVTGRTHPGSASGEEDRDSVPALLRASLQPEGTFSDRESDRQLDLSNLGDDSEAKGTSSQTKTAVVTSSRAKTAVVNNSQAKTAVVTINLRKRAVVTSRQAKTAVVTSRQTKTAVVTSSQTKTAVVTSSQTKRAGDGKERVSHKEQVKKQTGKVDDEEFESKVETVVAGSRVSYHCRDCGKKFLAPAMMKYHLLQHRSSHPHPCSACAAVFDQHQELNMHIRSCHPLLAKKLFPAAQGDRGEDEKPESLSEETSGFEAAEKQLNGEGANPGTEKLVEKNVEAAIVWADGKRVYSCLNCGQRFSQRSRMKSHLQIHVNHRPHTCHECGVSFNRKYHLQRHTSAKHPPTGPPVEACKKEEEEADANEEEEEDNDDALPEEVKTEKDSPITVNGSESFSCRKCGQTFTKRCSLARHGRSHTNERRYSCKKCGSAFYRLSHLKMHVMRKHQSVRPFICTLCTASFTDAYHLHRHEVTHTEHQPYKCAECQLAFSNTRQLKNHLQSHLLAGVETDEPTQNTETRGRGNSVSFSEGKISLTARCVELENADGLVDDAVDSSSSSVNVDLQGTDKPKGGACLPLEGVVTPDTDASPSTEPVPRSPRVPTHEGSIPETDTEWRAYAAVNSSANSKRKRKKPVKRVRKQQASASHGCDAALPSSSSPQQHSGPHTGEKPYLCKQCGQGFTKRHAVKRHELLHLGVKPFVCRECSRAFSRHSHLVKHCRQHTGERPYVCSVCGASFLEPSHLKRHNRKHTGGKGLCRGGGGGSLFKECFPRYRHIVQELCESRGGRPELAVLTSLLVSMDVKNY